MHAERRVRVGSLDVRSSYSHGFTVTFERLIRSRKFVPTTQRLIECEFSYKDDGYKKKVCEMSSAWNQTRRMKSLAVGLMTTHEYNEWWVKRINNNVPRPSSENS
ncbi:hypothetical protein Godav_004230 [Gossypium davidsonii]|uniref:Uncharacterized protein n=1 Tax=Gossypium davidsonii TaxID=34287 RepID=A0A7J8SKD0_GOSDV|nr:hypothetical protein [Gossypium davidsonii]